MMKDSRVDFAPFTIKRTRFEKPQPPVEKEWIAEIRRKEIEFSYHATEDLDRMKKCFERGMFDDLCKAFGLEHSHIGTSTKHDSTIKKLPSSSLLAPSALQTLEEELASGKGSSGSEAEEAFRKSVRESIKTKGQETKFRLAPYKIELSSESSEHESSGGTGEDLSENMTLVKDNNLKGPPSDLCVYPPSTITGPPEDILDDFRSPYQTFFCKSKKEIENHLNKNVQTKTHTDADKIFLDLIEFLNLPDIKLNCSNITLDSLRNLFDIRLENPAAHAFCADTAELPYVPKEVADAYGDLQASSRASLHRQIIWDIMYEKGKEKKVAFGKGIPKPRRKWNKETRKNWLLSQDIPWELVSGQDLWKDLLKTEILEGFAKWLLANPQYDRPKYLEKIGYFERITDDSSKEDPVKLSLKKKRCGEAFYTLANNMKYFIGDNDLSYLPRLEELQDVLQSGNQVPGEF